MTVLQHFLWVLWCFHLFTSFGTSSDLYRCPKISVGVMRTFREKCYRFVPNDKSWDGAQYDCQRTGGNLVHIKDRATQNFIYNTVKKDLGWRVNGMWIGAHDSTGSNNYEWVNDNRNRKGAPVTWSFWADGQPSCSVWSCAEFCGQMRLNDGGKWHDYRCGPTISSYHYCCMYDMGPKRITTTAVTTTVKTTRTTLSRTRVNTTTTQMKSTTPLTRKTTTTEMETATKATTTIKPETAMNETAMGATTTMEGNTPPEKFVTWQVRNVGQRREEDNTSVSVGPLVGWLIAGVMVLLVLLLFIFVFRRRRRANTENPTPNIHFTDNSYGGESQPAGARSPAAAHISQTVGPSNCSPEVEMTHGNDRERNELNRTYTKVEGSRPTEWRESTNPYDTIPFDEDFEKAKTVAPAVTEYLNAISLRRQDNGSFHALRDPGSLESLHRPRSTEENEYCNIDFPMGESAWCDAQSDISQPTLGFCGKQLDGYLSPSQIARPLSGVSSTESVKFPDSVIVMPQASGNDSTATVAPSSADLSRMQLNDLTTIPNLETLSANRQNLENPYLSISESNI